MSRARERKFGSDDRAFGRERRGGSGRAWPGGRPSPGCDLASFLNELLLLDQAAEILLVQQPPGKRLDAALQLQQREGLRHQFEDHGMVFDLGAQPGDAGRENAAVIDDHGLARARRRGELAPVAPRLRDQPGLVEQLIALQDQFLVPAPPVEAEGDGDARCQPLLLRRRHRAPPSPRRAAAARARHRSSAGCRRDGPPRENSRTSSRQWAS